MDFVDITHGLFAMLAGRRRFHSGAGRPLRVCLDRPEKRFQFLFHA
jgi:hypothetical protein